MARVNVGVDPKFLADQHLIAEHVEITMITGSLRKQNFKITNSPPTFRLGTGHINFFKNKILYLKNRLEEVKIEMIRRNFKPSCEINLSLFPENLNNDWNPSLEDTKIIRERIISKLKMKSEYYRYRSTKILNIDTFSNNLKNSNLYKV